MSDLPIPTQPMKLLIIVPHPDDEVYGAAGTILDYLAGGFEVGLVTLTRGEAGRNLGLASSREELATLRAGPDGELKQCLAVLGITQHHQYNIPDGGVSSVNFEQTLELIIRHVQEYQPEIVLTFQPNGSNGHPDHIATHTLVYTALERLGRPCTLWYYSAPREYMTELFVQKPELEAGYVPPNVFFDVTHRVGLKLKAISMHRSQALSTVDFFRRFAERITLESYHQAYPTLD